MDRLHLRTFREAPWANVEQLRAFVESVGALSARDVDQLLAVVTDGATDVASPHHRNRCSALKALILAAPDASHFAPLAAAIPRLDAVALKAVAQVLPRVNDVSAHPALCRALGVPDRETRAAVREVLEAVGGPSALRALTELVGEPRFAGRREAMAVMVPKARHRAIDLLSAVLQAGTPPEQIEALRWLSDPTMMSGGLAEATRVVQDALDVSDARVAESAFRAFASVVDEARFFEMIEPRVMDPAVSPALVSALGAMPSARAIAILRRRARRGPSAVQLAVLRALEEIGGDGVLPAVIDCLLLEDPVVRRGAAEAVARLAASSQIDRAKLLVGLLRSPHVHLRRLAGTLASAAREDDELGDRVLEAVREEDWWAREQVLDALVELGLPRLAERLVRYLGDESPLIRRFAIYGLLRLRHPQTLGALLRTAAADPDWWVREQATQAVGELGDRSAVPYLLALVTERWDLRVAALEALQLMHANDELLALAELTADPDPAVAMAMLEVLARLPRGREASFYVQACLGADEPRVAKRARELLEEWKLAQSAEASVSVGLLDRLLVAASREGADDVLLGPGRAPYVKKLGSVEPVGRVALSAQEVEEMLLPILKPAQREMLAQLKDVDLSYDVPGFNLRYRINAYRELGGLAAVLRRISQSIPELDALGLPPVVKGFPDYPNGLVLVGGPTGSGKSTTLAALLHYINIHHGRHVVTIEDPIEVVHSSRESLMNQREVGSHAKSFADALRATLRQDPDVILVGELRDQETIEIAVNAAETGHLVFATVHTTSAAATIDRLVHSVSASRQGLVRSMLSESLRAVLCQQLLRRRDEPDKRVLACEVMLNTDAVSNLIRLDKAVQINSVITTQREQGMQLMDGVLEDLTRTGVVDPDEALLKAVDKTAFGRFLEALRRGDGSQGSGNAPADRFSLPPKQRQASSHPPGASFAPPALDSREGES